MKCQIQIQGSGRRMFEETAKVTFPDLKKENRWKGLMDSLRDLRKVTPRHGAAGWAQRHRTS